MENSITPLRGCHGWAFDDIKGSTETPPLEGVINSYYQRNLCIHYLQVGVRVVENSVGSEGKRVAVRAFGVGCELSGWRAKGIWGLCACHDCGEAGSHWSWRAGPLDLSKFCVRGLGPQKRTITKGPRYSWDNSCNLFPGRKLECRRFIICSKPIAQLGDVIINCVFLLPRENLASYVNSFL